MTRISHVLVRVSAHRDYTAVGDFTDHILKLNRRVVNVKPGREDLLHAAQNGLALRGGNVFNADVAGERVSIRPDAPHVNIMDIVHAGNSADAGYDFFHGHSVGNPLQQDVERLLDNSPG